MEYIICLKWGGLHGHMTVQHAAGEVLYVLRSSVMWSRAFPVIDADGEELFRVRKGHRLLGSAYLIRNGGHTVATAGSNRLWSRGYINVVGLPALRCKYGWGPESTLVLRDGARSIGAITIQRGFGVRGALVLHDARFDDPRLLVASALVFRDWTSRG